MPDFLKVTEPFPHTRIDRLDDGSLMCCICFEWCHPDPARDDRRELYVDSEGQMWDMCVGCGEKEDASR